MATDAGRQELEQTDRDPQPKTTMTRPSIRSSTVQKSANSGRRRVDYSGRDTDDEFIEKIAWLMDRAIPLGGGWSIGLDPILGLIPGVGDVVATAISSMVVVRAYRRGIPRATLLRMVANVGIDAVVGAVPLVGDVFDWAYKANTKNLQLYREALAGIRDTRKDLNFLIGLLAALAIVVAIPVFGIVWLLSRFGWF